MWPSDSGWSPSTASCGIKWLAVVTNITRPQNTRVPSFPGGKKTMSIAAPMKSTNIRMGVRKPQMGHKAKIRL